MLLIKKDIPNEDNEVDANQKTVYCCANCNTELPEDQQYVTKRVPNPYMTEEMFEFNRQHNPEKAYLINEVNEKIIIVCPECGIRNKIHDYRWY